MLKDNDLAERQGKLRLGSQREAFLKVHEMKTQVTIGEKEDRKLRTKHSLVLQCLSFFSRVLLKTLAHNYKRFFL